MLATFVLTSFDDRRVTDDQIAAWAVRLGPVSSSARGVRVVDGAFEWQLTIEEIPGGSNVKLEVFSSTQGPTMSAAVLERVGDLYRSTGARLGVGAADEVDVVSDASRVSRLDIWWSAGALLVDPELGVLARQFRRAVGERGRWSERPLEGGASYLVWPGWFGAEGERDDDGLFSPFHRGWPLEDDNENRYDALTVSGFGHAPSQLQADDTVRRLVKSDLIELEPLPYGYPRPAFVAGMLNYVRMHFLSKLRGEGVKEEQRTLIERALDAPLDRVVDIHGAAISALMTRAVLLKTAAGPAALFWPQTPDHICLAMPLGEEIYSDFVASEAQLRVASHFIEALGLDRGGASVGDSAALQLGGLPGALAGTHPLVVHRDSDGRYRHRIDPSWPQPFSR